MSPPAGIQTSSLDESCRYCRQITRAQARNFYYALRLVPEPKRTAMYALYAWMRLLDDIADDTRVQTLQERLCTLDQWEHHTHAALDGQIHPQQIPSVWPAVADMAHRYNVPRTTFDDAIQGQRQDLAGIGFANFVQLREYCRQVAGTVGIASIHIWGFHGGDETITMAVDRGIAFQLTNVLRDLREDVARGRVYLPQEELQAAGVHDAQLKLGGPEFDEMMRFQVGRAEEYYRRSAALETRIEKDCRPALVAMTRIYHGILQAIAANPGIVLRQRVSLSWLSKLMIGWQAIHAK